MNNRSIGAFCLLLSATAGCAKHHPSSPVARPGVADDTISNLTAAVATSRARLDSVVLESHRTSGDASSSAADRSRRLKTREAALDSAYRANLTELIAALTASIAGMPGATARFPVERPPTPFVRAFADGTNWMLQSPFILEIRKDSPYVVIVPRGFVTDFVSIPKPLQILRGLLPTTERYGTAALVHDYLYWTQDCTREQSDNIMEIAMKEAGVALLERRIIHEGVRQFGQAGWDENRKARQAGLIRTVGSPHDQVPPSGTWDAYQQWLREIHAKEGLEYRVPASVCAAGDQPD